jgi:hypothetical protein
MQPLACWTSSGTFSTPSTNPCGCTSLAIAAVRYPEPAAVWRRTQIRHTTLHTCAASPCLAGHQPVKGSQHRPLTVAASAACESISQNWVACCNKHHSDAANHNHTKLGHFPAQVFVQQPRTVCCFNA